MHARRLCVVHDKMEGAAAFWVMQEDLAEGRWRPRVSVLLHYRAAALKQKKKHSRSLFLSAATTVFGWMCQ